MLIPFRDDEEALAIANDSPYGLSGQIVSRDVGCAVRLAGRIRSGEVIVNGGPGALSPFTAFGGNRRSGFGRQGGEEGIVEYMNRKVIHLRGG